MESRKRIGRNAAFGLELGKTGAGNLILAQIAIGALGWMLDFDTGYWMLDIGYWILNTKY
ncbi:hypothetical protein MASR2M47_05800 [Draconibacterium sp.]